MPLHITPQFACRPERRDSNCEYCLKPHPQLPFLPKTYLPIRSFLPYSISSFSRLSFNMAFYISPIRNASRRNSQQYISGGAMNPLAMTSQAYLPYAETPQNPPFQADQRKGSFSMTGIPNQGMASTQSTVQTPYDMTYAPVGVGGNYPVMYGHASNHSAFTGMYNIVPPNQHPVTYPSTMIHGSAMNQAFSPSEQVSGTSAPAHPIQYFSLPVALLTDLLAQSLT